MNVKIYGGSEAECSIYKQDFERNSAKPSIKSSPYEEYKNNSIQKQKPITREMQYSDEQNSNEIGSNISDNEPLSSSLFITPNPTTQDNSYKQEEQQKAPVSSMAMKMKSMQDMLNQKLKKVKNINWDLEEV